MVNNGVCRIHRALTMTPRVDGDGVLVGGQRNNIHTSGKLAFASLNQPVYEGRVKVVPVEITKRYDSGIAIVGTQRPSWDEGIAREAFRRKWPERGGWRHED